MALAKAREAPGRPGALCDIEHEIAGQSAGLRRAVRQEKSRPKVDAFRKWSTRSANGPGNN